MLEAGAGGDDSLAEVVELGWAFGQEGFDFGAALGEVAVDALNVGGIDAAAGVEFEGGLQGLAPGEEMDDQELPETGNGFEGLARDVRGVVDSVGREHRFAAISDVGDSCRGDVELLEVAA